MLARMRDWLRKRQAGSDRPATVTALKRAAIGLAVLIVCAQFIRLMVQLRGDFDVHWESGRRIAAGEPLYAQQGGQDELGHNYPYPPFWALVHAPFSRLPILPGQLLLFPLFVLAGFGLIRSLNRLTKPHEPLDADRLFLVVAGAIFMSSRFLVRDMPECGVNLGLVALSWLAVECWVKHRDWAGGWCLGLAISLKCTPALFWAWFLWKRQWKMAGTTLVAAGVFTLSPILVMGPAAYGSTMLTWIGHVERGISGPHPAYGVLGDEPLQNFSLRPALARYLTVLPAGHRSRVDHPLYFDGWNLPPRIAGGIIKGLLLALVLAAGFLFRQRVVDRKNPAWLWEAAGVSVLILLLSPITWGQHCVGVLPAFYLLMRRRVFGKPLPGWTRTVLWTFIAGTLLFNRELIGKDLTYLLDSYRLPTLFLLGVLLVMLRFRALVAEECQEPVTETHPASEKHARSYQPAELATNH